MIRLFKKWDKEIVKMAKRIEKTILQDQIHPKVTEKTLRAKTFCSQKVDAETWWSKIMKEIMEKP